MDAGSKQALMQTAAAQGNGAGGADTGWVDVPGFHLKLNLEDIMHCVYLGIAQDLVASALMSMLEEGLLGPGPPDIVLLEETNKYREWCKAHNLQHSRWTFSERLFGRGDAKSDFAILSSKVKAAQVKVLLAYVADRTYDLCTGTPGSRLRARCLWALMNCIHILDTNPRILTPEVAEEAYQSGRMYLRCYQELALDAMRAKRALYKAFPGNLEEKEWGERGPGGGEGVR